MLKIETKILLFEVAVLARTVLILLDVQIKVEFFKISK
jgi:hypothetical protein